MFERKLVTDSERAVRELRAILISTTDLDIVNERLAAFAASAACRHINRLATEVNEARGYMVPQFRDPYLESLLGNDYDRLWNHDRSGPFIFGRSFVVPYNSPQHSSHGLQMQFDIKLRHQATHNVAPVAVVGREQRRGNRRGQGRSRASDEVDERELGSAVVNRVDGRGSAERLGSVSTAPQLAEVAYSINVEQISVDEANEPIGEWGASEYTAVPN